MRRQTHKPEVPSTDALQPTPGSKGPSLAVELVLFSSSCFVELIVGFCQRLSLHLWMAQTLGSYHLDAQYSPQVAAFESLVSSWWDYAGRLWIL